MQCLETSRGELRCGRERVSGEVGLRSNYVKMAAWNPNGGEVAVGMSVGLHNLVAVLEGCRR